MMDLLTLNDRPGEYPPSYYHATANPRPEAATLDGDARADVCIIGGGFTGLSAALHLARAGVDVVLLEAQRVGWGASGRNGGQIGMGQRVDQDALEKMLGADHATALWDLSVEAKALIKSLIAENGIACDLKDGILYTDWTDRGAGELLAYAELLERRYGYGDAIAMDADGVARELGSTVYRGALLDRGGGHLHPLNYALGLAHAALGAGARLHERTKVTRVHPGRPARVETASGTITADHVIHACNGYQTGLDPVVEATVMPINNFIVATEPLGEERARELIRNDLAVADSKFVVNYFRLSADRRLLFGGGESYGYRFPADIPALVRPNLLSVYPQLKHVAIDYAWGGTLGITMNRLPHFAVLDDTRISAAGFSGHGVAMATLAGKLAAGYVTGAAEGFAAFQKIPHRRFPGGGRLRHAILVLAMSWYAMRDRLGI